MAGCPVYRSQTGPPIHEHQSAKFVFCSSSFVFWCPVLFGSVHARRVMAERWGRCFFHVVVILFLIVVKHTTTPLHQFRGCTLCPLRYILHTVFLLLVLHRTFRASQHFVGGVGLWGKGKG